MSARVCLARTALGNFGFAHIFEAIPGTGMVGECLFCGLTEQETTKRDVLDRTIRRLAFAILRELERRNYNTIAAKGNVIAHLAAKEHARLEKKNRGK